VIGVLQRSFRMPSSRYVVPFFVMFGSSTMGLCRKFVLLGGSPVCPVHGVFSCASAVNSPSHLHEADQSLRERKCLSGMALDRCNLDEPVIGWPIPVSLNSARAVWRRFDGWPPGADSARAVADSAPSWPSVPTKRRKPCAPAPPKSFAHKEEICAARATIIIYFLSDDLAWMPQRPTAAAAVRRRQN